MRGATKSGNITLKNDSYLLLGLVFAVMIRISVENVQRISRQHFVDWDWFGNDNEGQK